MKEREAEIEAIGKRKAVLQAYKATLGPLVDIISKNMDENINQQVSKQSEMNRSEAKLCAKLPQAAPCRSRAKPRPLRSTER